MENQDASVLKAQAKKFRGEGLVELLDMWEEPMPAETRALLTREIETRRCPISSLPEPPPWNGAWQEEPPQELFEFKIAKDAFRAAVGEEGDSSKNGGVFLERIPLASRLLFLASLVVGAGTFYIVFILLIENAPSGVRIRLTIPVVMGFLSWAAFLAIGARIQRLKGGGFWGADDKRRSEHHSDSSS